MDSPEINQSYTKRDMEEASVGKSDRVADDEEWDESDRRRHRSSKSRRSGDGEDPDGWDGSGRRKSFGERSDSRKRSGGSRRVGSDEDEYDTRKDTRSKQIKKKNEGNTLEKLSNWYQDGELDGGDKSGSRYLSRKTTSKFSDHEKAVDKDSRSSERREGSREKSHGSSELGRNTRRRSEEPVVPKRAEESHHVEKNERSGKGSGSKHESSRERSTATILDASDSKGRVLDANIGRAKSYSKEEKKVDLDKLKGRSRSDAVEEDNMVSPLTRDNRSGGEKIEKYRDQRTTGHDSADIWEKSSNVEDDGNLVTRDKNAREVGDSRRSRTPDRSDRYVQDLEKSGDYDRSSSLKRKELDNDGHRDDRLKGRNDNWGDRNRDREGSRDNWKRRLLISNEKEGNSVYERDRDWDVMRRGRDRMDNERPLGRSGNRKDGRGEAVKASSNFGISTENYDVIEIQTKPLDFGREDVGSAFGRKIDVQQSDSKAASRDQWAYSHDEHPKTCAYGSSQAAEGSKDKFIDDGATVQDQDVLRDEADSQGRRSIEQKMHISNRSSVGPCSSSLSQPPYGNHNSGQYGRAGLQGIKGGRGSRTSRVRPSGRENQQASIPMPLMGSPFGPLGMPPPGPMQPLNPSMSPAPGPQIPHGVLFPPFSTPVWPGARGVDMNLLPVSPGVSPMPPGQRYPPNMGNPSNPGMYFNQPGSGIGVPLNASGPGFNSNLPVGRGQSHEKGSGGWVPAKSGGPVGKAPSRGEQNDYSQNFVDTGMRPQNFIRELELTNVEDYPKLRELIQKKDEIVANAASPPMYYKCDLHELVLSSEFFGTKFDVILVDPPWEEYVHRAPGVTDHMNYWTFEEIMNLKIEAIADTPSFIFLWVGDGVGLEQGRQCLKKWGFRRCEDICWVKTNKHTATPSLRHDSHTLFQHSKEHCLMGIKGTVRRSTDGHIIHANIDTDVIIAEEPPYGSTAKPDEIYRIIEHFALGRRRIELFGEDHNIRAGWLTVGKGLSSSNFSAEPFCRSFADKEGKVWQGGGGRNPPPDAPHLVQTTPEIESLRPKSPMKNQQQLQTQQSTSISLTTANSSNRRPTGNSPQNPVAFNINQEASSDPSAAWPSPLDAFKGRDFGTIGPGEHAFDLYRYSMPPNAEYLDFETQRAMNLL